MTAPVFTAPAAINTEAAYVPYDEWMVPRTPETQSAHGPASVRAQVDRILATAGTSASQRQRVQQEMLSLRSRWRCSLHSYKYVLGAPWPCP